MFPLFTELKKKKTSKQQKDSVSGKFKHTDKTENP